LECCWKCEKLGGYSYCFVVVGEYIVLNEIYLIYIIGGIWLLVLRRWCL
jgi:hypothetical protein